MTDPCTKCRQRDFYPDGTCRFCIEKGVRESVRWSAQNAEPIRVLGVSQHSQGSRKLSPCERSDLRYHGGIVDG